MGGLVYSFKWRSDRTQAPRELVNQMLCFVGLKQGFTPQRTLCGTWFFFHQLPAV